MPKISIITACLNRADTIEQTIKSVVSQDFDDYEYIIVDGVSTDGTLDIIKRYADEYPDKIRYISEPDTGIYNAMNKGVKMARGEIISIIGSDDWYAGGAFRTAVQNMIPEKYYIIYGFMLTLRDGIPYDVYMGSHELLREHTLSHASSFVSRAVYEDFGYYNEKYKCSADYEFFLRTYLTGKVKFIPVYVLMVYYRFGGMSSTAVSGYEDNDIRYAYGCISRRGYRITRLRLFLEKIYKKLMSGTRKKNDPQS